MLKHHARASCSRIARGICAAHMHGRTDGRTHGESPLAPKSNLTATYGRLDLS